MTASLIAVLIVGLLFMALTAFALMPFFPGLAAWMGEAEQTEKEDGP